MPNTEAELIITKWNVRLPFWKVFGKDIAGKSAFSMRVDKKNHFSLVFLFIFRYHDRINRSKTDMFLCFYSRSALLYGIFLGVFMDLIYHNGNSDITLNQIYTFIVVAEYGNFTKASSELHISQPSISKIISKLEEATGLNLFIRNPRGAMLTNSGRILYQEWKKALNVTQIGYEKALSALNQNKFIRIGIPRSFSGCSQIFSVIQEFARNDPDIEISMEEADSIELRRGIAGDKYDVIFAPSYEADYYESNGYHSRLFYASPIELCLGAGHAATGQEFFSKEFLENETLLTLPEEIAPNYSRFVRELCQKHEIPFRDIHTSENIQSAYISLIRGRGYFFISCSWFPGLNTDGFYRYQLSDEKGGILMVWNKNASNPAVTDLKKCIHY